MQHLRDVQPEEGANLARRLGCDFYETSAKHGYNVESAFKTVVRGIKVAKGIAPGQGAAGPGGGGPGQAGARKRQRRNRNCVVL
jgi:GTPase KRas protein